MGEFFVYILKSSVCLAVFYLFYKMLLSRDTFHRFNRFVLLGITVLACALPSLRIPSGGGEDAVSGAFSFGEWWMLQGDMLEADISVRAFSWVGIIVSLYFAGAAVTFLWQVLSTFRMFRLLAGSTKQKLPGGSILVLHRSAIAPFSWMRFIVLSEADWLDGGKVILAHEEAHVRLRHSYDLLFVGLLVCIQWFNPAVWCVKRELQTVHEYEADEAVIRSGVNPKEYQLLLIKKAVGARLYSIANSFNHSSLKKRITMMIKRKSNPWARVKCLYALPLATLAVTAFARPEVSDSLNEISSVKVTDLSAIVKADEAKSVESMSQPVVKPDVRHPNDSVTKSKGHVDVSNDIAMDEVVVVGYAAEGKDETETIADVIDMMPEFPGGMRECYRYLAMNMRYPAEASKAGIEGKVVVRFVVEKDGSISEARVWKGVDTDLDAEALRIVRAMPKWNPGQMDGKPVRTRFVLPIVFKLHEKDSGSKVDAERKVAVSIVSSSDEKTVRPDLSHVLVLVDGKKYTGDLNEIDPKRIKSVSVLKDADDIAKYGAEGKEGVILITTKTSDDQSVVDYNMKEGNVFTRITVNSHK